MRTLEITLEAPSNFSGGGIVIKQSILSLSDMGEVDYVGPEFNPAVLGNAENIHILKLLEHDGNFFSRIRSLMQGALNGYYRAWKLLEDKIEWSSYDYVHVEFSKYPFLLKAAQKRGIPTIVRMHNIEADYYKNLYKSKKCLSNWFRFKFYHRAEKKCIMLADTLMCLTPEDGRRAKELFGLEGEKIWINPVCLSDSGRFARNRSNTLLITGSLWYGPNADGVKWFIKEVWPFVHKDKGVKLIVAGANPEIEIQKLCKEHSDIALIANPEDISTYFMGASFYLAPIFSGAGMKVKIAEALMYGLPIIATSHALIGYDVTDIDSVKVCESITDFISAIEALAFCNKDNYADLCSASRDLYEKKYSIDSSIKIYRKIVFSQRRYKKKEKT